MKQSSFNVVLSYPIVKRFFLKFKSLPSSLLLPRFEPYLIELYHLVESEPTEEPKLRHFDYFDLEGAILPMSWIHPSEIEQSRSLRGFIEHSFDELWSKAKRSGSPVAT